MSHIVEIQAEVRDPAALQAAAQRLGLPPPTYGTARLFSGTASGWLVQLPQWRYPLVCDTASGQLKYDDYNGAWGDRRQVDHLLQAYTCEKAKIEARRKGHGVSEQQMADGSIKLTIQVAGGAA